MPWVHYVPVQVTRNTSLSSLPLPTLILSFFKYTLTDVYDILAFFRGSPLSNLADTDNEPDILLDPDKLDEFRGNEHLARKIASAGREWSETMFRKEDMVAYMYRYVTETLRTACPSITLFGRLLLEYARVMALDRESMTMQV